MPQTFYELKAGLHFPELAGAIRRMSDLEALAKLNIEEASRYYIAGTSLERIKENDAVRGVNACRAMGDMHKSDYDAIMAFLKERE